MYFVNCSHVFLSFSSLEKQQDENLIVCFFYSICFNNAGHSTAAQTRKQALWVCKQTRRSSQWCCLSCTTQLYCCTRNQKKICKRHNISTKRTTVKFPGKSFSSEAVFRIVVSRWLKKALEGKPCYANSNIKMTTGGAIIAMHYNQKTLLIPEGKLKMDGIENGQFCLQSYILFLL